MTPRLLKQTTNCYMHMVRSHFMVLHNLTFANVHSTCHWPIGRRLARSDPRDRDTIRHAGRGKLEAPVDTGHILIFLYLVLASVIPLPDLIELLLVHRELSDVLPLHLVHAGAAEHQAVQRRTHVHSAELFQGSSDDLFAVATQSRDADGKLVLAADVLLPQLLNLYHLLGALRRSHEPRRLVNNPSTCEGLEVRLLDLDVQQYQRVQSEAIVILHAAVEAVRLPGVGEEHHADRLAESVQAQTSRADGRQDRSVGQRTSLDRRIVLPAAESEVGVRGGAEGVADHQEGDVFGVCVG